MKCVCLIVVLNDLSKAELCAFRGQATATWADIGEKKKDQNRVSGYSGHDPVTKTRFCRQTSSRTWILNMVATRSLPEYRA